MSVTPLRTDWSCPRKPRASTSASRSMSIASIGTPNICAFVAIPAVTQPASAESSTSTGFGAPSTPPSSDGSSTMIVKRRGAGDMLLPPAVHALIDTWLLVPRCQLDFALNWHLPSAGFSRTRLSTAMMPSRLTSFSRSDMGSSCLGEQLGHQARRTRGAVGWDVAVMHGLAQVIQHRGRQLLRCRAVVIHPHAGAEALEAARDEELLLEVIPEREVKERRAERRQLHRRREPALHDRQIRSGVMPEEMRHERTHLEARRVRKRRAVEPRAGHEHHPRVGDARRDERECRRALLEKVATDPGAADRDQDHAFALVVAERGAERRLVPEVGRVEVIRVPRELEMLARPLPHVWQVRTERAVEHVVLVAHHEREVADVGMKAEMIDVLGVLLPRTNELGRRRILAHRQHADEVGDEGVRRPLHLRVL